MGVNRINAYFRDASSVGPGSAVRMRVKLELVAQIGSCTIILEPGTEFRIDRQQAEPLAASGDHFEILGGDEFS